MALPVAKLGTLALRTLSKPIASRLKSQAAVHPKFRNFIIAIAQVIRSFFLVFFRLLGSDSFRLQFHYIGYVHQILHDQMSVTFVSWLL
jgi:hypothetical protein